MMLYEPEPRRLVAAFLLLAVRDGYDRYRLRPGPNWYDMSGRCDGRELDQIGPSAEAAQEFPAVLAELAGARGQWSRFRRWVRRQVGGEECGRFRFPVGRGSVGVEYRVRWARGRVAELDIAVAATDRWAVAAHQELQAFVTPDPWQAAEPGAAADGPRL